MCFSFFVTKQLRHNGLLTAEYRMEDNQNLSASETDKLLQFQDLTGIEDIVRCRHLLETHNWDLEVAVQNTLSIQEGTPSVFNSSPERAPPVVTHPADQRIYTITRNGRPLGLLGWSYFLFNFSYRFFRGIVTFVWRLLRADARYRPSDPVEDVVNFISSYESKYGAAHPVFYQGTYSQVLNDAKKELKFLLVYLHSEDHQDTDEFCSITLANPDVITYINQNMLFWTCSVSTAEGFRVSQALRENTYPFLAVVVLRENRMTVVARIEGAAQPQELIQRLQTALHDNEASLIAARAERHERTLNQTIRQQQDEAYLESLKADQEKDRKKLAEQQQREEAERLLKEREMQEIERLLEIQNLKRKLVNEIPPEPSPDDPSAVKILIKLPNGTRLERRFSKDLSLKYLYNFVFCHDESPDNFEIVTNFPRRVLACQPNHSSHDPPSFTEAGLGRSEMLFVNDLDA
ncbi:FAS-associated factor 2 [Chamberlinius hualienensis]